MVQMTSAELQAVTKELRAERDLFLKYRNFAKVTADPTVRGLCEQIAAQHKNHYDTLLQNLNA